MLKDKKILFNIIITFFLLVIISSSINAAEAKIKSDLLVYAAEPEGVVAAVAAAREDQEVILVMNREKPGGLMTYAALNFLDLNYDQYSNNINQGIFSEWHQQLGGSISFAPQKAEIAFEKMLAAEKNIKIINSAELQKVKLKNNRIESLTVKKIIKTID